MKLGKIFTAFVVFAFLLALMPGQVQQASAISPDIVISQVYGGGGNTGATYTNDFIELFNRGTSSVSLAGWSVQYASATGTGNFGANSGQLTELPNIALAPGQYLLIQETSSGAVGASLPTPDVTDLTPINMSGTAGKVAVVNSTASLGCNGGSAPCSPAQLAQIVDLVGYGGANFFEGSAAAPTLSNTTAAFRATNGCSETDENGNDFSAGTPNPRNTASPLNVCGVVEPENTIIITEIMYDPNSDEDNWEWIEIYNAGSAAVDLTGYVVDDFNSVALSSANIAGGVLAAGEQAVLYNADDVTAADFAAAWGAVNLVPVTNWSALSLNNAGDKVSLWDSFASYSGDNVVHANAIDTVDFAGAGFPDPVGASIYLTDLGADNNVGSNWATSTVGGATPLFTGYQSLAAGGNVGTDVGSPGTPVTSAAVIINELDSDTPGIDIAEFIELYDGGSGNTSLDGLVVVFYNGSSDTSYDSFDLDGYTTNADGYFVLGNPGVANVDLTFLPGSGGALQNGADAVALFTGDATDFPNGTAVTTTNLIDALVYDTDDADDLGLLALLNAGQPQVNENGGGDKDNQSNQRCPDGSGGARNTDSYAQFAPTPGAENTCGAVVPQEVKIHEVQGSGSASPLVGSTVIVEGIVVGDFQDGVSGTNGDFNGFYMQEEDLDADSDPLTSEGVFVFDGSSPAVNVAIGDLVRVEGSVSEFNDLTEITSFSGVTVVSSGNPLPTITNLSLPVTNVDDFEAYEGMYVNFPQALVISEYFNYDRFGELVLTSERHLTPTAEFEPGSPEEMQAVQDFLLDRITLDDGRSYPEPGPGHSSRTAWNSRWITFFRGGDTLTNVTGVMDYSFGLYRIQPTQGAEYSSENPRTEMPEDVGGSLKVASFNVLNYFTTLDDGVNDICGPAGDQECRGADDANELERQRAKIVAALSMINADVVGLMEIENNPGDVPTADLVSGLNDMLGAGTYDYIATGAVGTDAIRTAFIYKPASVTPVGGYAILDSSVDSRFDDTKNRPALAQTFQDNTTGGIFTVTVNHLKSKGSACDDVGDPDTGDGSGNCNVTRTLAAQALVDWLASDPTGSGDNDFLIIGDLNSYDKEDPIDAIKAGPDDILGTDDDYTDMVFQYQGEDAYSYVFDGQTGYLDHALASAGLVEEITGVTDWHINADEPDLIDYDTSFKQDAQDALYEPDPYRSSDHDPVIIGLDVCDEIAPTIDALSVSPDTLWPANHKYVDVTATIEVSDNFDPNPTIEVSITSNEPDNGEDDGDTVDDIVVVDTTHFQLRAERSGVGTGRIYTITYTVTDACGNSTTQSVTVTVPLSQGN